MAHGSATRAKPAPAKTVAELAERVRRDKGQVSRWTKRADWPFARKAPWPATDVPRIMRWMADVLDGDAKKQEAVAASGEKAELQREKLRQEIRKLRAQADVEETGLAKARGDLHDAEECDAETVRRCVLVRNAIQNVPTQIVVLALSAGMPQEAAPQLQAQAEELVNGCLRHLSKAAAADAEPADGDEDGAGGDVPAGAVDAVGVGGAVPHPVP